MQKWKQELLEYAEIAFNTGQQLIFQPKKRDSFTEWRIHLQKLVSYGKEKTDKETEED